MEGKAAPREGSQNSVGRAWKGVGEILGNKGRKLGFTMLDSSVRFFL